MERWRLLLFLLLLHPLRKPQLVILRLRPIPLLWRHVSPPQLVVEILTLLAKELLVLLVYPRVLLVFLQLAKQLVHLNLLPVSLTCVQRLLLLKLLLVLRCFSLQLDIVLLRHMVKLPIPVNLPVPGPLTGTQLPPVLF